MSTTAAPDLPEARPLRTKPRLRGVFHEAAFYAALGAGLTLVCLAPSLRVAWPLAVYTGSLACMLGFSALYHRPTWTVKSRQRLRRLDHCGIFLLIAGSYTPLCTLVLPAPRGLLLLAAVWTGALAGVGQSLLWIDAPKPVTAGLYILLGWLAATALPQLWHGLGLAGFSLLVCGGVAYTIGGLIYAARRPDPAPAVFGYHEIFHALTIVGAVLHFALVLLVVRGR
jgi:hemolysin III